MSLLGTQVYPTDRLPPTPIQKCKSLTSRRGRGFPQFSLALIGCAFEKRDSEQLTHCEDSRHEISGARRDVGNQKRNASEQNRHAVESEHGSAMTESHIG